MSTEAPRTAAPDDKLPEVGLDAASVAKLRALDPSGGAEFLSRVLSTYLRSLAAQSQSLRAAHETQRWVAVAAAAHALKSASASVGALALSGLCADIEAAVREQQEQDVPALVVAFFREAARVEAAVHLELRRVGSAAEGGAPP
jgi:HPt (histidine-containing phosphotransfer) domain-containing protein